jgi:hypothetical protein
VNTASGEGRGERRVDKLPYTRGRGGGDERGLILRAGRRFAGRHHQGDLHAAQGRLDGAGIAVGRHGHLGVRKVRGAVGITNDEA